MSYRSIRADVYRVLDPTQQSIAAKTVTVVLVTAIMISVLGVMLSSIDEIRNTYWSVLWTADLLIMTVFIGEYALRLWTCVEEPRFRHPVWGRVKYVFSLMAMIDLVAILPTLLTGLGVDLRTLRVARLLRLARALKFARYVNALQIIIEVVRLKRHQLATSFFFVLFILIVISTLMYEVEHAVQPDAYSSIPHTMWWAVATLTTVGYGDIYPVTAIGKILASLSAILGIGLVAIPTGILASGFSEVAMNREASAHLSDPTTCCPHCGYQLTDS
jgi:voltage-gated potassium channel